MYLVNFINLISKILILILQFARRPRREAREHVLFFDDTLSQIFAVLIPWENQTGWA